MAAIPHSALRDPHPKDRREEFEFLVDVQKPLLRTDEAARYLGRSTNYVYACLETGDLEGHKPRNRERNVYLITRRSVLLHLAETATYRSEDFLLRLKDLVGELTEPQLQELTRYAQEKHRRKFQ